VFVECCEELLCGEL